MLADQSESDQLAAIYAFDVRLGETKRKKKEKMKSKKKMKALERDANGLSEPDKMADNSNSTRHVNSVPLSEVDPHKTDGSGNTSSTALLTEVQSGDGSKIVEEYNNGERDNTFVRADCGINGGNFVYRTKEEEYKMIAELSICPQLSAMISPEPRMKNAERSDKEREQLTDAPIINEGLKSNNFSSNSVCGAKAEDYKMLDQVAAMLDIGARKREKNRKIREKKKSKKKMKDLESDANFLSGLHITPEDKGSMHVINVALPDTSEAQSGDCSKVVEECKNGQKTNKGAGSDGGINRDSYVYRTKSEEYKMIAVEGISPQLYAVLASEDKIKKSAKIIEKKALEKTEQFTSAPTDVTESSEVQKKNCIEVVEVTKDLSNCSQDATMFAYEATIMDNRKSKENKGPEDNQNSAVACVAGEQGESILEAPEATEKINTKDSLRSAIAIDPGFSFWEGHEETACLGTTKGNPEIEQAEAPVREVEEVFNRRDCGDMAAEIVKHGDSTKAAETAPSVKLGSVEKEDNFMLRKLLRKPRYYDFPNSSLQMCHICGEDDHKAQECTMVRRKKPCYLCGGFRHTAKRCSQGRKCFKCGGRGHLARDCLEEPSSNKNLDFCLRCGNLGHNMFACQSDYSSEDLKAIKCYVCKEFGHLCCDGFKYEGQTLASCYKCGQSGHLGSECIKQEKRTRYSPAKSFYDHEVKCHFAGKNGEHNKAGQCTHESTSVKRSFSDNDIIPNFAHAPL